MLGASKHWMLELVKLKKKKLVFDCDLFLCKQNGKRVSLVLVLEMCKANIADRYVSR
jgi:hypothetical protein